MSTVLERPTALPSRERLADFYDRYFEALDDLRLEEWPDFFVDDCLFEVIPRENWQAGYKLCTIQADSRGMLVDRVQGILKTQMYAPRVYRRFYSGLRATGRDSNGFIRTRQNVIVVQTLIDGPSLVHVCGVAHDLLEEAGDDFLFRERIFVIDSEMIPNSFIFPALTMSWITVATIAELEDAGGLLGRSVGGVPIALYAVDGEYFATADTCTHGQARLSDGYLEGHLIECPLHQGLFDIRTGEVKGPPCSKPIRTLQVREEDGGLMISLAMADEPAPSS